MFALLGKIIKHFGVICIGVLFSLMIVQIQLLVMSAAFSIPVLAMGGRSNTDSNAGALYFLKDRCC